EHEVADLDAQVTAVKLQNDNLVGQVLHELEISSAGLQEKIVAYEGFVSQLEEFQDEKLEELLTYGMGLTVAKCLNSNKYLLALGVAISKAIEKGMQEGLSVGITHGEEGRQLADVAAYNPSAEADYLSALQHLQNCVIGASALSLSLEVSHSRVKKMRENTATHVSTLRGVFVPLSEPLSAAALEGMEGTSGSTPDAAATLSTTFIFTSTILPISTDDYEVAHVDGQGGASVGDETAAVDDMNLFVSMQN
nr:hypothetical protein [Tanacetum cinerariifolium]